MDDYPRCDACGKCPEVYGSSWCAACAESIPEYLKRRLLNMRNALIEIGHSRRQGITAIREKAINALAHPTSGDA